jgi:hypothetical protein
MELSLILPLLRKIHGTTFATIDSETWSNKTIRCVARGERAILFRTQGVSGYENSVKRTLEEAGKDPTGFNVGPLPWGERVEDLPLIENRGEHYLQFIQLSPGDRKHFLGSTDTFIPAENLHAFGVRQRYSSKQGLPVDQQIIVKTVKLSGISRIALMGEEIFDQSVADKKGRAILRLNYSKE